MTEAWFLDVSFAFLVFFLTFTWNTWSFIHLVDKIRFTISITLAKLFCWYASGSGLSFQRGIYWSTFLHEDTPSLRVYLAPTARRNLSRARIMLGESPVDILRSPELRKQRGICQDYARFSKNVFRRS